MDVSRNIWVNVSGGGGDGGDAVRCIIILSDFMRAPLCV